MSKPTDNAIVVLKNVGTQTYLNNGRGSQTNDNEMISWKELKEGSNVFVTHQFAYQWQNADGLKFTLQNQLGTGFLRNNTKLQKAVYHQTPSVLHLIPAENHFRIQDKRTGAYLTFFNGDNCSQAVFRPLDNSQHADFAKNQLWEFVLPT